jgi:hypothetical protein
MKIELKNIKYAEFASAETSCYEATLWVDGKKIGTVSNEGRGGCDYFYGDQVAYKLADEWCVSNLPARHYTKENDGFEGTHQPNLESLCGDLLNDHLIAKDLAKAMVSNAIFCIPGRQGLFTRKYAGKGKPDQSLYDSVLGAHDGAVILNTLPRDEALKIYKENI